MHPTQTTNLDVVASDSITPMATLAFNLGQDRLRWLHVFSDIIVCRAIRFSEPGLYASAHEFTSARFLDNERRIDISSRDCAKLIIDTEKMLVDVTVLKADAKLYALKTVVEPIVADVTTLKTDVAKLKTDLTALTSLVNKLSTAPAFDNVNFWNSLRREQAGSGSSLTFLYYIPTAYIVGGTGGRVFVLDGVEYFLPRLTTSSTTIDPTFTFSNLNFSGSNPGFKVTLPGTASTDTPAWRQFLLNSLRGVGYVWHRFS
jgi:hypothetical protein